MQIIVMGTGGFGVPSVRRIVQETQHEIVAVVTMPPRGTSHGRAHASSPMESLAEELNLHICQADNVNHRPWSDWLHLVRAELFFVCDFGCILSPVLLRAARLGGINLHGSLLPLYRGAAPVQTALWQGESHTGVSVIHMTAEVDAGPVVAQSPPVAILPHETHPELERRLAHIGADIVLDVLERMESAKHLPIIPQKASLVSRAPKLKKEDGRIRWTQSAREIENQSRAMAEWPKTFTFLRRGAEDVRLVLGRLEVVPSLPAWRDVSPGTIIEVAPETHDNPHGQFVVVCGDGAGISVGEVQPAGKRTMTAAAFLRGHRIAIGDRFEC